MKKLLLTIFVGFTLFVSAPALAAPNIGFEAGGLAQKIGSGAGYDTSNGSTALSTTIGKIIRALLSLSGTLFLALTVYGGIRWMNSRGEEGEIEAGKGIIRSAMIGLAITMAAYAITIFVVDRITSSTGANQVGGASNDVQAVTCQSNGGDCFPAGTKPTKEKPLSPGTCDNPTDVCLRDVAK